MSSIRASENLRSEAVEPLMMAQLTDRWPAVSSGRASQSRSTVLWATVTKGLIETIPLMRGQAARKLSSSASVATLCRAATSTTSGLEQSAANIPPCWTPTMKSGQNLLTALRTVTIPARACFLNRFLVSEG